MQARSQAVAAQTDFELVPAPAAGMQIVVRHVFASVGTAATTVTLESGTTDRRWEAYLPINGTVSDDGGGDELFRCADGAALTVTRSGTGPHFTQVTYDIEGTTGT